MRFPSLFLSACLLLLCIFSESAAFSFPSWGDRAAKHVPGNKSAPTAAKNALPSRTTAEESRSRRKTSTLSYAVLTITISMFANFLSPFYRNNEVKLTLSKYGVLTLLVYSWLTVAMGLHAIPRMTGQYNVIIAFSLFVPLFASSAIIFLLLRVGIHSVKKYKLKQSKPILFLTKMAILRRVIITSTITSTIYSHCWSRTADAFTIENSLVCAVLFNDNDSEDQIYLVWSSIIAIAIIAVVLREVKAERRRTKKLKQDKMRRQASHSFDSNEINLDQESCSDDESSESDSDDSVAKLPKRPSGTLGMVPWYTLLLIYTAFDIFVQAIVFLNRFDARTMQLVREKDLTKGKKKSKSADADDDDTNGGTIFDCTKNLAGNDECWFDFMADCGDGFNSSYQVAKVLAAPSLKVLSKNGKMNKSLPRGDFLVVGGDLAYPEPSAYNYEKRFFRTFEDAMPPPPSFRKHELSTDKSKHWDSKNNTNMVGPRAFVIPGNHDWFDGLATFSRLVLSRSWLGGWLMPQDRSYFALALPKGWWIFGCDLALANDIDMEQFRFFENVAKNRFKTTDSVVIVTHEPFWTIDGMNKDIDPEDLAEPNLRELMRSTLRGKVRCRLAGDLHHYTRHVPDKAKMRRASDLPAVDSDDEHDAADPDGYGQNLPELIVSGGGGAFLHPTHTFENEINVGVKKTPFKRVCSYPNEKVSTNLSFLNIWQFRWRNWRLDVVWGLMYFLICWSLFPLCGIMAEFDGHDFSRDLDGFLEFLSWFVWKLLELLDRIFRIGFISPMSVVIMMISLYVLTDECLPPRTRVCWGCAHGIAHVIGALFCLIFISFATEWASDATQLSKAATSSPLVEELTKEYNDHFSPFFDNAFETVNSVVGISAHSSHQSRIPLDFGKAGNVLRFVLDRVEATWRFLLAIPTVKNFYHFIDIPGVLTTKHQLICSVGGVQPVDRYVLLSYYLSLAAYFFVLAIPVAGLIFGTWLTLTLVVFRAQHNEGFSSLRIQHWKNLLRCHVKSNGDLEVYALGLDRVPKLWLKDESWDGSKSAIRSRMKDNKNKEYEPSWKWDNPSKWRAERNDPRHVPRIIDYTCITKQVL